MLTTLACVFLDGLETIVVEVIVLTLVCVCIREDLRLVFYRFLCKLQCEWRLCVWILSLSFRMGWTIL